MNESLNYQIYYVIYTNVDVLYSCKNVIFCVFNHLSSGLFIFISTWKQRNALKHWDVFYPPRAALRSSPPPTSWSRPGWFDQSRCAPGTSLSRSRVRRTTSASSTFRGKSSASRRSASTRPASSARTPRWGGLRYPACTGPGGGTSVGGFILCRPSLLTIGVGRVSKLRPAGQRHQSL